MEYVDLYVVIPLFLMLGVSIGANILQGVVCRGLIKRLTCPPYDYFSEEAVEMLKDGNIEGGEKALDGAVEMSKLRSAPIGEDITMYETDQSINP